jgi:WD40 repeat protein
VENAGVLPASGASLAAVDTSRHDGSPGLREVWVVWALFGLVAAALFATYARLPVGELYHVSGNGRWAAAGRVLVFLNWPTALAAIAVVTIIGGGTRSRAIRRLCVLSALLCAAVAWPGIVEQADLDAKPANLIPASGALLALALTIAETRRAGLGPRIKVAGDRVRLVAAVVLLLLSLEWIVADLGFLIGRLPVLGSIFYSDEWWARSGHARFEHAVHHGHHHGMDGTLLALTAIVLSRTRLRPPLAGYLALMLAYGLAVAANDFWLEQVVKRELGVTWEIPSVIVPRASVAWLVVVVAAAVFYFTIFRPQPLGRPLRTRRLRWPIAVAVVIACLAVVGLLHGTSGHETPLGRVDGLTFAAAPNGKWGVYTMRGSELARLSDAKRIFSRRDEDLAEPLHACLRDEHWHICVGTRALTHGDTNDFAPARSPDGKQIAFVSDRDGNDQVFVMRADGTHVVRVTSGQAEKDRPAWRP